MYESMKYSCFKTFTTSYYFHSAISYESKFMFGLYTPYGGLLSKLYWWLFQNSSLVRRMTAIEEKDLPFSYEKIKRIEGMDSYMSFNLGSPGVEQKISILGYDYHMQKRFFAKYSEKPAALQLTKNEIAVYQLLAETGLTPRLLKTRIAEDYVYMKTEFVSGHRPESSQLSDEIVNLCISLASYHLKDNYNGDLKHCLSHGDFCPWNMLCLEDKVRLIDWELAEERPLGYDLFTFICQVSALFESKTPLVHQLERNKKWIDKYFHCFGISDITPYLKSFLEEKIDRERQKGNTVLLNSYLNLYTDTLS